MRWKSVVAVLLLSAMSVTAGCASVMAPERRCSPLRDNSREVLERYDDDGNGRITCKEARQHRIAPVPCSHPAYPYMLDGDKDGVVCE